MPVKNFFFSLANLRSKGARRAVKLATMLSLVVMPTFQVHAADAESIVKALKAVAGNPPGVRATFAKGQCVGGVYNPAPAADEVTTSESLTQQWPVIGRFSVSGGKPGTPDNSKTALRGFSIKILSGNDETHLLFENAPIHFAKNLDQMLGFLKARAPGPDGKPDQAKIAAFSEANPETTRQAAFVKAKEVPASYAGVVYWGVHTFYGLNSTGNEVPFKFKVVPHAGELGLTDAEAESAPADFLVADLAARLKQDSVKFDLQALLAENGDDLSTDVTLRWKDEDNRKAVTLGTISVTTIEPNEKCDESIFDPGLLADGIGAPKDEIFSARTTAYAISLGLRSE